MSNSLLHQKKVTLYRNLVEPVGTLSIRTIIDVIRSERFKPFQLVIQDYLAGGNKEQANEEKKKLFSFTASCQCHLWRSLDNVTIYTSYIIFDIDGLTEVEAKGLMVLLSAEPYVMAAFRSPSWRGVKFIIETDTHMQDHKYAYEQAAIYYERLLARKIDRSGSDICRLCFIGHDPLAFSKEHAIFKIMLPSTCPEIKPNQKYSLPVIASHRVPIRPSFAMTLNPTALFSKAVRITIRRRQFIDHNRNNFCFLFACNCRFLGMNQDEALIEILKHYNYSEREIKASVRSAYRYK